MMPPGRRLAPATSLGELWPAGAVVVQRVADDSIDWLPQDPVWREASTASTLLLAGGFSVICHQAGATPEGLQLLRDCGFFLPPQIITYQNIAEIRELIAGQIRCGRKIGITYPSREMWAPAAAHVNEPALISELNDKAALPELLPADTYPARRLVGIHELGEAMAACRGKLPLVLKASTPLGSGACLDVFICRCRGDLDLAHEALLRSERVVVEEYHPFIRTWCMSFGISDRGCVFLGAPEQICDEQGKYHGNWRTPAGPGVEAVEIGTHAAWAGHARGYRGFLGVDVGRTDDGRILAFDLNFRNNGSTVQNIFHDALTAAWGISCTRVCHGISFIGTFGGMLAGIRLSYERREVVPLLTFDTAQHGLSITAPRCNLLIASPDPVAVEGSVGRLRSAGFEIDSAALPLT